MIAALLRRRAPPVTEPLHSARLRLLTITPAMLEAEAVTAGGPADRATLAVLLGAEIPAVWPPSLWEPAVWLHIAAQLGAQPSTLGWHRYMLSAARPSRLIGCVGGFPCAHGDVELGYSVADAEQGKGFASEAVETLTTWLLRRPEVRSVSAQTFEDSVASVRVMQRCGMACVGVGDQPGTVRYRRW